MTMLASSSRNQLEDAMDAQTQKALEDQVDTLGARADELERRLDALLDLMRRKPIQQFLGIKDIDFLLTEPRKMAVEIRTMKHSNERHRAIATLRRNEVLSRLERVSPARLADLLRER
jgi:hypothetical protein